ncbi:probable G-protein coupled receptor 83 [Gigantopelta aegis]|uniref:probable G-protein coupled receptor 83 n=1 Tax=Gigantopelta aegis TaxID=1735272 RepID=UPI001B88793F|nr:probable G-protein coupled receptor 83 [Gigantopelta aegis]
MAFDDWSELNNFLNNDRNKTERFLGLLFNNSQYNGTFRSPSIFRKDKVAENSILIIAYSILCVISLFGNSLVCYVILKNKRLHTATNFFIANLAISDLLVTCLNVPFNIIRHMMDDWLLGDFLCNLVNFSLMVSVYVSTYTLTVIAIDRHRLVLTPLSFRMSKLRAVCILGFVWIGAISLALPYGIYQKVKDVNLIYTTVRRCRTEYPEPSDMFEQYLTVLTIIMQYCTPLTLIALAYGRIVLRLWARTHVGAVTAHQQLSQHNAKKRSIKLLITVVVVFALCWLPLNLYHLLTDLHPNTAMFHYDSTTFFICHWVAISSTCYNPFVYCWLNEQFREEVKARFRWCYHYTLKVHPRTDTEGLPDDVHPIKRHRLRSSTHSSSRTISLRRETILTPEKEDFSPMHVLMYKYESAAPHNGKQIARDEAIELIPKYENGKVEFFAI